MPTITEKKIEVIRKLTDNWNGYGAQEITKDNIKQALDFYGLLSFEPVDVTPIADGRAIQFDFTQSDRYADVEIYADGKAHLFIEFDLGYMDRDFSKENWPRMIEILTENFG